MLLEPAERLPPGSGTVREAEVAEHALEVVLVEIAYVPEHGLVAPVAGGHVHRVHHLLEVVVDDLDERALLGVELHDIVEVSEVVVAVVLADEVVEVHQELRGGHRAHELRRN